MTTPQEVFDELQRNGGLKHIRFRQTDGREFMADLRRKISGYEEQYGMTSAEMAALVKSDQIYETLEIFRWMSNYRVLASLEAAIPTAGTPSQTTESSRPNA